MVKKNYKFKVKELIFFIALISFIVKQISVYSVLPEVVSIYGVISKGIEAMIILLFLFYLQLSRYSIKSFVIMLIVLLTALVASRSGSRDILFLGILLFMSVNIENKKIIKTSMITLFCSVSTIIFLCVIKVIPNKVYENLLVNGTIATSNSLGFDYYSYIPIYTLFFTCMYLYCKEKKCRYIEIVLLLFMSFIVNYYCHKELAFGLNIFTLILYMVLCKWEIFKCKNILWRVISILIIPLSFLGIVICSYNYPKFISLDKILGGRLYYGYTAFNSYDVTLFGNKIEMIGSSSVAQNSSLVYFYIDSGYLQTLFLRGIILTAFIIIGYISICHKSIKDREITLFIWITVTAGYNILGSTLVDIWYNPLFFIAFKYIANWKGTFKILSKRYRLVFK